MAQDKTPSAATLDCKSPTPSPGYRISAERAEGPEVFWGMFNGQIDNLNQPILEVHVKVNTTASIGCLGGKLCPDVSQITN